MLVSIGVLVLRYTEPDRPRPFRVPFVWPVSILSAAGCVFIMKGLPHQAWERFGYWLVIGLVLYFVYGYQHSRLEDARNRRQRVSVVQPLLALSQALPSRSGSAADATRPA